MRPLRRVGYDSDDYQDDYQVQHAHDRACDGCRSCVSDGERGRHIVFSGEGRADYSQQSAYAASPNAEEEGGYHKKELKKETTLLGYSVDSKVNRIFFCVFYVVSYTCPALKPPAEASGRRTTLRDE